MIKKKIKLSNAAANGHPNLEEAIKTLESLLEWKYESTIGEIAEELEKNDHVVLILYPDEPMVITSYEARNMSFECYEFDCPNLDDEYGLCMLYDSDCVITLGDHDYLVEAPIMILNTDDNGNECNITSEEVKKAVRFMTERETMIEVEGEAFPAIRLAD